MLTLNIRCISPINFSKRSIRSWSDNTPIIPLEFPPFVYTQNLTTIYGFEIKRTNHSTNHARIFTNSNKQPNSAQRGLSVCLKASTQLICVINIAYVMFDLFVRNALKKISFRLFDANASPIVGVGKSLTVCENIYIGIHLFIRLCLIFVCDYLK